MSHIHTQRRSSRHGFSLVELTIVLGVFGVILAGVWVAAATARQSQRVSQSVQALTLIVDGTRASYGGMPAIAGGVQTVMPILSDMGVLPVTLLRNATSTCGATTQLYTDTPWGSPAGDVCGTFRVCAWDSANNTACNTPSTNNLPAAAQSFAVEFTQLNYGSCLTLAENVQPSSPAGLQNVYINTVSGNANNAGLPVAPAFAAANCKNTNTNTLDFIYSLRAPSY